MPKKRLNGEIKIYRKIKCCLIFALIIMVCLPVAGCYDATEIDEEVYALAIGVDKGVNNMIRVTFQYATYKGGGGGKGGGGSGAGGGDEESGVVDGTVVSTVEAPSLLEGINLLNAAVNRQVSLMHAKMLVFSEEYAREGVGRYVEPLVRFRELREFMRVVVCNGTAEDFIMENKTFIGINAAKNIELMFEQSKKSGYFPDVIFNDFYIDLLTPYGMPTAIYAGVNDFQGLQDETDVPNPELKIEQDIEPGEIPRKGGTRKELFGTAVFDGDRMVGTIQQNETRLFLMVLGEFRRGFFTLEDPNKPGYVYVLEIQLARNPEIKAWFANGKPVIDLKLTLDGDIISIQSRYHYEKDEKIEDLERLVDEHFNQGLKKVIEKTQKEWNADIFHFGNKIAGNFKTIKEFEDYNWIAHYQEAKVNTQVEVSLRRSGYIYGANPIRSTTSKQGEEEKK